MGSPGAALLIIGDEILSGRTQDKNINYIANGLAAIGVDLKEVRVVPDVEKKIIDAVNHLRAEYAYLFTTGGIGPTHDDITADAIAKAFGTELYRDEKAYLLLEQYYGRENLNEGRIKMSYVPKGSELIDNPITVAPGFKMGNVFAFAGVPKIMQAMFEYTIPHLEKGVLVKSVTIFIDAPESKIAAALTAVQNKNTGVSIGSYPQMRGDTYSSAGVQVVVRGRDYNLVDIVADEIDGEIQKLGFKHERL